jgi:membrane-associated phospholipid phosphatase
MERPDAAPPRIARNALLAAAALGAVLFLSWLLEFHVGAVQRLDAKVFGGFVGLKGRPHVGRIATLMADSCNPSPYVYLCVIPIGIAIVRRRLLIATGIMGILAGANLTTHLLKPVLAASRPDGLPEWIMHPGSWPSGHATASMALALCTVLACPGRVRPYAAAIGAAFAVAVSYSFLTLGWHYPSDAFAGMLVASIWTLLGIAGVAAVDERRKRRTATPRAQLVAAEALTPPAAALAAVLIAAALVLAVRPEAVLQYARAHTSFIVGAAGLGALALALATGVMMTLRR